MNCHPGQIARYVGPTRNRQRLVSVESACNCPHAQFLQIFFGVGLMWRCIALQRFDAEGSSFFGVDKGEPLCVADALLRPLYDGDAADEMLLRFGKPIEIRSELERVLEELSP